MGWVLVITLLGANGKNTTTKLENFKTAAECEKSATVISRMKALGQSEITLTCFLKKRGQ